jgi:ABC-2 type transport system ATP-binding protein
LEVEKIIAGLHRKGTTSFLTTHYIEEAERLCERIAFIVDGKIVRTDRTADLLQPVQGKHVIIFSTSNSGDGLTGEMASAFPQYQFQFPAPNQIRIESAEPVNVGPLVRFLEERNIQVTEARRHVPSLEDVFVQVTGIEAGLMRREKEKAGGEGNQ